jgi:hypothetical protein
VVFVFVSDPVVVGFGLPEGLSGAAEDAVGFAGGEAFEGVQKAAGVYFRKQKGVDVVRHDYKGSQVIVA